MQRPQQTLDGAQESYGRVKGRTEDPKEDGDSAGRLTEATKLDPWRLSEIGSPTKE